MLRYYLLLAALCTATTIFPVTQPAQGSTSTQTTTQADSSKQAKPSVFSRVKTFCCDNKKAIVVCLTVAATGATVYYIVRNINVKQNEISAKQDEILRKIDLVHHVIQVHDADIINRLAQLENALQVDDGTSAEDTDEDIAQTEVRVTDPEIAALLAS